MNESSFLSLNTRFRPTPTADIHAGHVWVAYHNWAWARNGGGKFIMIVDDILYNLPDVRRNQSFSLCHSVDRYVEDFEWLGIGPDEIVYSSRNADAHGDAAEKLGFPRLGLHNSYKIITVPTAERETKFGYHPWLVMTRVVDDHLANVTGFWRGMDLISEMFMYDFVCRSLGWLPPGQGYLPLVRREGAASKESKKGVSIRQLRERGYHPASVLETIRECGARSLAAGLNDCVIPAGVLELDEIKFLPFDDNSNRVYTDKKYPWSEDVKAHWKNKDEANALRRKKWKKIERDEV